MKKEEAVVKNVMVYSLLLLCGLCMARQHLKVLMVVPVFPKIHDVCMLNQMTGLVERDHNLTIYAEQKGDDKKLQDDVNKYHLLSHTIIAKQLPKNLDDYDIVVFQLGHKAVNIKKTHNYKGKVVICLRGYDITGFIAQNPHAYDEFFDTCDLFMPVCECFKDILEQLGCSPDKIIVHHSGIDCARFSFNPRVVPDTGPINLLSAGRFVEKKGFEYSIRAVAKLIQHYPRIYYTIIGDGILKRRHLRLIKRLGMEKHIKLVSWYPHEEYIKVLDAAHIFIVPSVTARDDDQEGIPNVLKEAMAKGLFVIATDHSGNSEIVKNNISGFLVPERDSDAIMRAIEYIVHNSKKLSSLQNNARDLISEEFDNERVNDKLENIFLNLVNNVGHTTN